MDFLLLIIPIEWLEYIQRRERPAGAGPTAPAHLAQGCKKPLALMVTRKAVCPLTVSTGHLPEPGLTCGAGARL